MVETNESNQIIRNGYAILINQVTFDDPKVTERDFSTKEVKDLQSALEQRKFTVDMLQDATYDEILRKLNKVAKDKTLHSKYDCLMVVVTTHHDQNGRLLSRDAPYCIHELWEPFGSENQDGANFKDKPKLFIVHACCRDVYSPESNEGLTTLNKISLDQLPPNDVLLMYSTSQNELTHSILEIVKSITFYLCKALRST